jgi:phosphomannomutase
LGHDVTTRNFAAVLTAYVGALGRQPQGARVLVGYDTRFMSPVLAGLAANLLEDHGVQVTLADACTPTPAIAYGVRHGGYDGGLAVTASHNPPMHHGVKFLAPDGTLLPDAATRELEAEANRRLSAEEVPAVDPEAPLSAAVQRANINEGYLEGLQAFLRFPHLSRPLRVAVDPLFGTAGPILRRFFEAHGIAAHWVHDGTDPTFGGLSPAPSPHSLEALGQAVREAGSTLGLATDADADRFGLVDEAGTFVQPNIFMALVAHHLLAREGRRGPIVRTISTTHLLDRIAERHGCPVIETHVGFKHVGRALVEHGALLGCEESGGMALGGHLPDKDGIAACLVGLKLVVQSGSSLTDLIRDLFATYGPHFMRRLDVPMDPGAQAEILEAFLFDPPRTIAGVPVASRNVGDGIKLLLEDGSWFMARAAGTERALRFYLEALRPEQAMAMEAFARRLTKPVAAGV